MRIGQSLAGSQNWPTSSYVGDEVSIFQLGLCVYHMSEQDRGHLKLTDKEQSKSGQETWKVGRTQSEKILRGMGELVVKLFNNQQKHGE